MKRTWMVLALSWAVPGCGRDALVAPHTIAVTLTCPLSPDDGFGARGGILLPLPLSAPSCSFSAPKVPEGEAMEAMVRMLSGVGDPDRARELTRSGLSTTRSADRNKVIEALFSDASARDLSDRWMSTWLELSTASPSVDRFDTELWRDALEQTFRQGRAVFVEGSHNLASLVNGSSTFINPKLAALYNVMPPSTSGFALTKVPPQRPGVFGQAAVLGSHPAVSLRGELLLKAALGCQSAPPPPAGTPDHITLPTKLVARAALEAQLVGPVCTACHSLLSAGFLLHAFDERGVERKQDIDGAAIRTNAAVNVMGDSPTQVEGLTTFAKNLESSQGWHTCLAQALVKIATERAQLPAAEPNCAPAEVVAATLRQSPGLKNVLPILATTLFGGVVTSEGVNDPAPPPEPPPSPTLDIDGRLSRCTPIDSEDLTCDAVCEREALQCGDHTCRLAGTLGGAFFFSSQNRCANGAIASTLNEACGGGFAGAACNASAPLTWVRCCCGD